MPRSAKHPPGTAGGGDVLYLRRRQEDDNIRTARRARAFFRAYTYEVRDSRVLHIILEDGPNGGRAAYCPVTFAPRTRADTVIVDPMPTVAPDGLTWCWYCVGQYARRLGALASVAALLSTLTAPEPTRPRPIHGGTPR